MADQADTHETLTAAAAGLTAGDIVNIDVDASHVVELNLHCPAQPPCPGRPGVMVEIPVRRQSDRSTIGIVHAAYCPRCRSFKTAHTTGVAP